MRFIKNQLKIVVLLFLSLTILGCEDDDDANIIGLDARFITSIEGRTVSFINISSRASSFQWNFDNGTISSVINPVITFDNGTYNVILRAFDDEGNIDTFEDTIVIDIPICTDETAENIDPGAGDINWTFLTSSDDTTFDAFGDTAGFIVDNPVLGGVNNSCRVQRYEKTAGCQTFAGLGAALATPIDFSATTNKTFTMKVLAENQLTDVTLRLEFMAFPNTEPSQDREASITEIGEWQELTFDFSDVPSGTFSSMIIYFERNAPCDGDVYYFDDIIQQ